MDRFLAAETLSLGSAISTVSTGSGYRSPSTVKTYEVRGQTTAGAGAATVKIEGSMDNVVWDTTAIGTVSLTLGTTTVADAVNSTDRFKYVRLNVTAISGTGASVTGTIGY